MGSYVSWLLANETAQTAYLFTFLAVLVLPLVGLAIWFHSVIGRTEGGRRLMALQSEYHKRNVIGGRPHAKTAEIFEGLRRGEFGEDVAHIYRTVLKVLGYWMVFLFLFALAPFVLGVLASG